MHLNLAGAKTSTHIEGYMFTDDLEKFNERLAFVNEDGISISFSELAMRADALAAQIGKERRLLLIESANEIECFVAYVAALRGRHVVMFATDILSDRDRRLVETWRPDVIYARVEGEWSLQFSSGEGTHMFHPELAVLLATSGSTGSTKLVRLSRANVESNTASIIKFLSISPDDRAITTLPCHYSYGLSVVNSHLAVGATILVTERSVIDPAFWDFARLEGVTAIAGVPFTYELFDRSPFLGRPPATLRTLTQAGGRLPAHTVTRYAAWAEQNRVKFFVMYGQTEATARMAYLPPEHLRDHPDCIGIAIPGGKLELLTPAGNLVETADIAGELAYTGPNVMMGYADKPADLIRGADVGRLLTGDIAERTQSGLFRIVGRKSRFSKIFGLRINLDEIEAILVRNGWQGVATGDDEIIAIEVVGALPATVARTIADEIKIPVAAIAVASVAEHPRLASGKIDYRAILASAHIRALSNSKASGAKDIIESAYVAAFGSRGMESNESFVELGGDSLNYVNVSMAIEEALGTLPDGWETMTREMLLSLGTTRDSSARATSSVPSDIVLRSLAIIAIIVNHASSIVSGGGSIVLWILVGYSMARFQLSRLEAGSTKLMVTNLFSRIVLPYYIILILYFCYKHTVNVPALLLVGNFKGNFGTFIEPFWFIEALVQITLMFAVAFKVPFVRNALKSDPWRFGIAMLVGALFINSLVFSIFGHRDLANRTPDSLLYLVSFGWCLQFATTAGRKWVLFGVATVLSFTEMATSLMPNVWNGLLWPANLSHVIWLLISATLLLWVPLIRMPRPIATVVISISSATFYIYIVHGVPIYFMREHFHLQLLLPTVVAAIVLGMGLEFGMRKLANPDD